MYEAYNYCPRKECQMISIHQATALLKRGLTDLVFWQSVSPLLRKQDLGFFSHKYIHQAILDHLKTHSNLPSKDDLLFLGGDKFRSEARIKGVDKAFGPEDYIQHVEDIYKYNVNKELFDATIYDLLKVESFKGRALLLANKDDLNIAEVNNFSENLERSLQISATGEEITPSYEKIMNIVTAESRDVVSVTPWPTINHHLKGGLARGEYGFILTYTNVGKSTILCAIGYQALASRKTVLHITIEDSERETLIKYVSLHTGECRDAIGKGEGDEAKLEFIRSSKNGEIGTLYTYEGLEYVTKASEIEHIVLEYERKRKCKIDVLIVDYAQVLKPETVGSAEAQGGWAEIEDTHRTLRKIGRKLDVAIWSAHQAAEGANGKREKILKVGNCGKAKASSQVPEVVITFNETGDDATSGDEVINLIAYIARNRIGQKYIEVPVKVNMKRIKYEEG